MHNSKAMNSSTSAKNNMKNNIVFILCIRIIRISQIQFGFETKETKLNSAMKSEFQT